METQNRNIDWTKSWKKFATIVWGIGTYLGLLVTVAWFAIATGNKSPWQMTFTTIWLSTWLNWMAFMAIDRASNNR